MAKNKKSLPAPEPERLDLVVRSGLLVTPDGIQQAVSGLRAAAALDLDALCDAEVDQLMQDLQLVGRLQGGLLARFARCWEQRGIWSGDGSKSPAARMARDGSTSQHTARTVLWRGRRLETTRRASTRLS